MLVDRQILFHPPEVGPQAHGPDHIVRCPASTVHARRLSELDEVSEYVQGLPMLVRRTTSAKLLLKEA